MKIRKDLIVNKLLALALIALSYIGIKLVPEAGIVVVFFSIVMVPALFLSREDCTK